MPRIILTTTQRTTLSNVVATILQDTGINPVEAIVTAILATGPELMAILGPRIDAIRQERQAALAVVDTRAAAAKVALQADIDALDDLDRLV
jgi:metal-dependent amidase/aminoacylase/carboxypeptidase family protein